MGFISKSLLVLFTLYGLVFAIGDAALMHGRAPLWWGIAFVSGLILLQYLVAPWLIEWFFKIDFDEDALPAAQRTFVKALCAQRGLPRLRLGLIRSGMPNAFAFGRLGAAMRGW